MKASKTILALLASSALVGCGSSDNTCTDAGCPDGAVTSGADAGSDGPMLWGLSRDMNNYKVTAVSVGSDGCMESADVMMLMGMSIPANYNATTNTFALGKPFGTPQMPAFGSGTVGANMATLTRDNQAGDAMACYWHQTDTSMMKLFNHDQFTLDVSETLNMFAAACTGADAPPAGGTCTSTFQLTLEIQK